jgi:hypothetical protein
MKSNVWPCFANPDIAFTLNPTLLFNVYIGFVIDPPRIMMTDSSQIGARPALAGIEDSSMRRTQLPLLLCHVAAADTQ